MKFSLAVFMASAASVLASPTAFPPLKQCSSVECSSNADCANAGCFGCDLDVGKCGQPEALTKKQAHFQCFDITCIQASIGPGGDEQCASQGCGVCSPQGKCQDVDYTLVKKQFGGGPMVPCYETTCVNSDQCIAGGCSGCTAGGKCY